MSAINGDKARFHRKRKAGIARRARNRERLHAPDSGKAEPRPVFEKKGASS